MALVDVLAVVCVELFLNDKQEIIGFVMIFAAGGILYLIFQDIAPLSKRKKDWIPATGASIGFLIGMMSEKLL